MKKWLLFLVLGGLYLFVKSYGIHPTASGDENTYFYMARLLARGQLPYRDFFYAHPPLQLLLLGLVYAVFGYNFLLLKLTSFLPVLAGAGILYSTACRRRGCLAGFAFMGIFLFGYEALKITSHPFGLNLTVFFLCLSLSAFLSDRPGLSGLWTGLAGLTGLYAAPWGLIPVAYYLINARGSGRLARYVLFAAGVFFVGNAFLVILFGRAYVEPVYAYHLLKPPGRDLIADVFIRVLRRNPLPFFLPLLYVWGRRDAKTSALIWAGTVFVIFLARLNPLFTQYFLLPLPFLSLAAAESLVGWRERFVLSSLRRTILVGIFLLIAGSGIFSSISAIAHERITGFEHLSEVASLIRENSQPDELLFGHVTYAPLIALESDRQIALNMVDTNHMRFRAGLADLPEILERLADEPQLRYVVIGESRFWLDPRIRDFLRRARLAGIFPVPQGRILVYDLKVEP